MPETSLNIVFFRKILSYNYLKTLSFNQMSYRSTSYCNNHFNILKIVKNTQNYHIYVNIFEIITSFISTRQQYVYMFII